MISETKLQGLLLLLLSFEASDGASLRGLLCGGGANPDALSG